MKIKIGINGMGRIGRMILRSIFEGNKDIEIKHINNRTNSETCSNLLKYDSIHGKFKANISFNEKNLIINNSKISFGQEPDLNKIDWKNYDAPDHRKNLRRQGSSTFNRIPRMVWERSQCGLDSS